MMNNVKHVFARMIQIFLVGIIVNCTTVQAQPGIGQNFLMADAARATSKLLITPRIVSMIKQLPNYSCASHSALTNSIASGFDSQTRADAAHSFYKNQGQAINVNASEQTSLFQEIVNGEFGVQTDVLVREALARILSYFKIATIEEGGAFRLGMTCFGTSYDVASDVSSAYGALHDGGITNCTNVYASSILFGFMTAYSNLFLSERLANYVANPLLNTMAYLAIYMFLDPIFKRMSNYAFDMEQCPGASELYGFGGDFCYFATGVIPDNINFANQVH